MKIYLDNCCFNRPYDKQDQLKIKLETEAKQGIQDLIKQGKLELVWSYVLSFENSRNPSAEKRLSIQSWAMLSSLLIKETEAILLRTENLEIQGLSNFDALHIACAISAQCTYFISVDKAILAKADKVTDIKIINPIDFIREGKDEN